MVMADGSGGVVKMDLTDLESLYDEMTSAWVFVEPYLDWWMDNWVPAALTLEIVGGALAVMLHRYRLGLGWLLAAIGTIWFGGQA